MKGRAKVSEDPYEGQKEEERLRLTLQSPSDLSRGLQGTDIKLYVCVCVCWTVHATPAHARVSQPDLVSVYTRHNRNLADLKIGATAG